MKNRIFIKSLSKANAKVLKEAHGLLAETHQYRGTSRTSDDHKAMLGSAMKRLKAVFQNVLSSDAKPLSNQELGEDFIPPPPGKGYKLTQTEMDHCKAAHGIAAHLGDDPSMHIAGRAMCRQAAAHIKAVFQPTINDASTDDLGAALLGKMLRGRRVSPGILVTLRECVDDQMEHLGDILIEEAFESGELLP